MKRRNILVFPCGSEIGLNIYSSVTYSTYFKLVGASSIDDHGMFIYDDYIGGVPFITDNNFIPTFKKIIKEREIDAIYPAMDSVITFLKEHEEELGCYVIAPTKETTEICLSKRKTYEIFRDVILTPKVYKKDDVDDYPVFVKPNIGYGAIGTKKIESLASLDDFLTNEEDMLILEYLPGEEFTVDCFTDKDGNLLYSAARGRNRVKNGVSINTSFAKNQSEFEEIAIKINEKIDLRGAWFYQVKRNIDGKLCLLEIAARLGGSSLLSRAIGVNLALLTLFDAFGYKVSVQKNEKYSVILDRVLSNNYIYTNLSYSKVYVDYDDCLILDKKNVNADLVKFLYKCINEGKKIVLLTKHTGELDPELKKFRLSGLFDEILQISKEEKKSKYIDTPDSIFFDDSFAERVEVQKETGISVFSPEMVDVLQ